MFKVSEFVMESEPMDSDYPVGLNDDLEIREFICKGLDFEEWVSLIAEVEKTYYDNIEKISLVYDTFLSEFPLCHGYWRRYADYKIRLCSIDEVVSVFERSVQSATYSVAIWVDYCTFCMSVFENPSDIRRLFKRGLSYVGKDYLCHTLWDIYIKFELSQQQWSSVAQIYVEALRFPTKRLHIYYDRHQFHNIVSFKKLAALNDKGLGGQSKCSVDLNIGFPGPDEVSKSYGNEEICSVVKDLFDPSISFTRSKTLLQKYITIGEHLYNEASRLDKKVRKFEANIRRTYFHIKPLGVDQLENWHRYLNFVETQEDFDWAVKIYERCLIPCANYPEFWMRYVEFMETKGGREIANYALNRATKVILKRLPVIHLFSARFKEHQGDVGGAHSALLHCDVGSDSEFVDHVVVKANMERRLGNFLKAAKIFEEAIALAAVTKKWQNLPSLYVHFSRLKHMITDSSEAARDVLIRGIDRLPGSKFLLKELIHFATMNGGQRHIQALDCVIDTALSPGSDESRGLDDRDAEEVSHLYLKFVDLFGTILDVRKAWNRHIKLFPHTVRTSFSEQPAKSLKSLKLAGTDRETSIITEPHQLSEDCCPDNPIKLPLQYKEFPTGDSRPGNDSPNRTPEQIAPAEDSNDTELAQAPLEEFESRESTIDEQERVASPSTEVTEQSRKDVPETSSLPPMDSESSKVSEPPMDSESSKVSEPPMEDITELKVAETGTKSEQDLNVQLDGDDVQPEFDHVDPEQDVKSLSLVSLTLHPQDDSNPDLNKSTLSRSEAPHETSNLEIDLPKKDEDTSGNSQGTIKASDSSQNDIELASSSFSTANQGLVSTEPPHQPQIPTNSGIGNWGQTGYSGKVRKETNFGPRGQVQTKPRLQHQVSPQVPQAESVGSMPVQQGFPPRLQVQPGWRAQHPLPANPPPNAWPQQIMPKQNFPSLPQPTMQGGDNQVWRQYYHLLMQQHQQHYRPPQQLPYRQQYYQQPPHYQQLQMQQQQYNQFYQNPVPQQLHPQPVPEPAAAIVMPSQVQDQASTPSAKHPSPPGRQ